MVVVQVLVGFEIAKGGAEGHVGYHVHGVELGDLAEVKFAGLGAVGEAGVDVVAEVLDGVGDLGFEFGVVAGGVGGAHHRSQAVVDVWAAFREDVVDEGVEAHEGVPICFYVLAAGGVHMGDDFRIIGEEDVGLDSCERAW